MATLKDVTAALHEILHLRNCVRRNAKDRARLYEELNNLQASLTIHRRGLEAQLGKEEAGRLLAMEDGYGEKI